MVEDGALLLDVREADEWDAGHAPEAVWIPMGDLQTRVDELPRTAASSPSAAPGRGRTVVAGALIGAGYDAVNLDGGMRAWAAEDFDGGRVRRPARRRHLTLPAPRSSANPYLRRDDNSRHGAPELEHAGSHRRRGRERRGRRARWSASWPPATTPPTRRRPPRRRRRSSSSVEPTPSPAAAPSGGDAGARRRLVTRRQRRSFPHATADPHRRQLAAADVFALLVVRRPAGGLVAWGLVRRVVHLGPAARAAQRSGGGRRRRGCSRRTAT